MAGIWTKLFNPDRVLKEKLAQLFSGRKALTNQEFIELFFKESKIKKDIIEKTRDILITHLGDEYSLMYPDDDWSKDFSIIWDLDSMADVELIIDIEKTFKIKIPDAEAQSATSFRKLVTIIEKNRA
jgi:acyl carrier protein